MAGAAGRGRRTGGQFHSEMMSINYYLCGCSRSRRAWCAYLEEELVVALGARGGDVGGRRARAAHVFWVVCVSGSVHVCNDNLGWWYLRLAALNPYRTEGTGCRLIIHDNTAAARLHE